MANKIMFGADLVKVLEKEYKLNKLGEVPTKYKNGVTTIDFIYGKEKDIDDLKYDKPYVEFSIDDETDGFISGTMYLNGGVEGIQFDSYDDIKYFMKNVKWTESKKFTRKSMKESTDEDFSLYDLNKHDPFVKEWVKNINKELNDVSIESIGDDEIVFRVWFDENIDLDIFDDIVTDCMPKTLIEFMSDMNIDFGYQFVYADDKFTENDFVFIRFVVW